MNAMQGTIINTGSVVIGSIVGLMMGKTLKNKYKETTVQAVGVATTAIGFSWFIAANTGILFITAIGSFIFGGLLGELLHIENGLNKLGEIAEKRFAKDDGGRFQQAFVSTSILFCIGPMTLLGCIQDGLGQGYSLLLLKSILDAISSAFFAAALGPGVLLSAVSVLIVQGGLTLGAGKLTNFEATDPRMIAMVATGGLMLVALGLKLLNLKAIRVSSFLPGIFIAPFIIWLLTMLGVHGIAK